MSLVILPSYQPDETLISLTEQLWDFGCMIIVVDDGSGKEYQPVFDKIKDRAVVLRHEENRGKGAAIKTALAYVRDEIYDQDCIGIMDSDGQHLPEDMMKLLEQVKYSRDALVLGVREVGKDMPLKSRFGNLITRKIFRLVSGETVTDTQTGLRAFDRRLVKDMLKVHGERYEYEMNVLMQFVRAGIPVREIPIHTIYHDQENSCSHFRAVRDSVRIYREILKFAMSSFSSFLLDYTLFTLMMIILPHTFLPLLLANISARLISAFYNYSVNCHFVFHTKRKIKTAFHYFLLAAFILLMNNVLLETFVQTFHFLVYPAKILTEILLFLLSFLVQNLLIFRRKREEIFQEKQRRTLPGKQEKLLHKNCAGSAGTGREVSL